MVASGVSVLAIMAVIAQVSACPLTCGDYSSDYASDYSVGSYGVVGTPVVSEVVSTGPYVSGVSAAPVVSSVGSSLVSGVVSSSRVFGNDFVNSYGAAPVQERVAPGSYSVALDNNGPSVTRQLPVIRTQATAPVQQRPTVRIPATIPPPRTVSNCCKCVKTIVKPQVIEQVVTVPSVQRYIQTSSRPVVERIHYNAVPVNSYNGLSSGFSYGVSGVSGLSDLATAPVVDSAAVVASPYVSSGVVGVESAYPVSGSCTCSCA